MRNSVKETYIKSGEVIFFPKHSIWGKLKCEDGEEIKFCSTSFHSRPARYPRVGDKIDVIFNHNNEFIAARLK